MFFYAGAALAQPVWDSLFRSAEREIGERIVMTTGMGMTESSPFGLFVASPNVKAGDLGLPTPGLELKLVDTEGKTELRYRGPNITPGYWRAPADTADAFDDEGFFKTGDAVKWIDETDIHQGLTFDGRMAEDFKLATGTFVSVGPLRAQDHRCGRALHSGRGDHRPQPERSRRHGVPHPGRARLERPGRRGLAARGAGPPAVLAHFQTRGGQAGQTATGSANRVARLCLLADPPTIDRGEVTDKGSINQRAVLGHRR